MLAKLPPRSSQGSDEIMSTNCHPTFQLSPSPNAPLQPIPSRSTRLCSSSKELSISSTTVSFYLSAADSSVTVTDNNAHLDFTNADALRALTTALLHHDFNLTVKLRDDRLCPTLANRYAFPLTL